MNARDAAEVLDDLTGDRLLMAGCPVTALYRPSTVLRFASGARVQIDGVTAEQLAALQYAVAVRQLHLRPGSSPDQLLFGDQGGDGSDVIIGARRCDIVWDPF